MKLLASQEKFAKLLIGNLVWASSNGKSFGTEVIPIFSSCPAGSPWSIAQVAEGWIPEKSPMTILDAAAGHDFIWYKVLYTDVSGRQKIGWVQSDRVLSTPPTAPL